MSQKKGIDLKKLKNKIVTNEQSVIEFFKKFPDKAFTIEMLNEEGFSSNIRKVLNRLIEKDLINKTNIKLENKKKWVTAYFNASSLVEFILQKTEEGWIIKKIKINGDIIELEVHYEEVDNSYNLTFDCEDFEDIVIYYSEIDNQDNKILRSVRYSEIVGLLSGTDLNIEYLFEEEIEEPFFEIFSQNGVRKRVKRNESSITGSEIQQSLEDFNFDISVDHDKRTITIMGSIYKESENEDEPILIDSVSLGNWDEEDASYDYIVKGVENIILYY